MESYQPSHHHYMGPPPPPPPSMAGDPHYPLHHQQPPPPPPANPWYSGQFQYHPSHSPSPPPPQQNQNQWGPSLPPPPPPYHGHTHQPYPAQQPYPPPPPHPPRPSQAPHPPYQHQDWANANWSHHAGWEYPAHGNEEDWEAKARAWASARSAMENQHPQTQFTSVTRQEEPSHYANQHAPPVESQYQDVQETSIPTSGFQNYLGPVAPLNRQPMAHQQEPASISSYAPDAHLSFAAKNGTRGGDMSTAFPHHQGSANSLVHQQEVPSSYSSVPGKEDGSQGQQHGHSYLPDDARSVSVDHAQFAYGNHSLDPMDQPLNFVPRFGHENDPKMKFGFPESPGPVRGTDSVSAVSSLHAWPATIAPGVSYPPISPTFPSAQHDPSIGVSPLSGQTATLFGRGPSFQPAAPSITTPVGLVAGTSLHSTSAFPIDAYGTSLSSERPKKAAVPNWLREEIIKNKATITSTAPDSYREESQSNEDEIIGKFTTKGDQADSKSMDSARSAEDEDDDEDYEEMQKTAAINQEIKRVLTEVLLKVTDELFDEIATKVLSEEDLAADAISKSENHVSTLKASPPLPPVLAYKASAKVLVPVKAKESEGHASGESSSGTPGVGNVLGLANYTSDDDDEIQTSSMSKSDKAAGENGHQQPEDEDYRKKFIAAEGDRSNGSSFGTKGDHDTPASKLNDEVHKESFRSSVSLGKKGDGVVDGEQSIVKSVAEKLTVNGRKETLSRSDVAPEKENVRKSAKEDSQERDSKRRDRHESKRNSSGKDSYKETEIVNERKTEKEEPRGRRDEKRQKKDKTEDYNVSRERPKEQDVKHREKTRESDSRRRSPKYEDKDSKKEKERDKKKSGKDDADKKRERTKVEKGDKSRHKSSSDASRHKRRRSLSVGRVRKREESAATLDGSDDEASDDSRRNVHSNRCDLSPTPVRSKRRQVSRSPHSKHSQRRHSPYSSFNDSRGRRSRSRSRSPVRRHR